MIAHASWPVSPLLAVAGLAALTLVVTALIDAAILYIRRARWHVYASRFGVETAALHRNLEERNRLVGALAATRAVASVAVTAASLALVVAVWGLNARLLLITAAGVAVVIALLQAIPRILVKQNPERWGHALTAFARVFLFLLGWLEPMFELPCRLGWKLAGASPPQSGEAEQEELLRLVEFEESTGGIEPEEREMIRGVIGLEDTTVREIMVPRLDIAAVGAQQTVEDAVQIIVEGGFSRIPIYEGAIDEVSGIIYAKDLLRSLTTAGPQVALKDLARPAYFIPETKRVDELLEELRRARVHIAIVIDEFGGTAGLVTIEDLLEEIVGEIEDEYDRGEATIERRSDDEAVVDARVGLDALNDLFGMEIENEHVDTLGGLVYDELGRIPQPGDQVQLKDLTITVLAVTGHRLKKLLLVRTPAGPSGAAT